MINARPSLKAIRIWSNPKALQKRNAQKHFNPLNFFQARCALRTQEKIKLYECI